MQTYLTDTPLPERLVWSNAMSDELKERLSRLEPNRITICQKWDRDARCGAHYHITVDDHHWGFIIASFDTMKDFKNWLKAIDVKVARLELTNKTPGNRVYQGQLDKIVLKNMLYWHTKELPFNELTYVTQNCVDLDHHSIGYFHREHRYPVLENGSIVWGYIQATDNARIVWAPNANSELYQPLPWDYAKNLHWYTHFHY